MNDKDEDRCCPSHERRKLLTCSSSTACARTVGHQFSHVGSTLTTFVRRFSLAFFFRLFFSVFTFGLVVSTAGRAAYRGYIYFSWCSVRFHSRRRRSKKKKKKLLVMHVCWRCRRRHAHSSQAAPNLHEFISTLRKSLQALNSYTCSLPSLASLLNVSHFVSLYQR